MNEKKKVEETKIEGQLDIAEQDVAELKVVDETADTLKVEMPDKEIVELNKTELEQSPSAEITTNEIEPTCECEIQVEETTSCADHISRTKILDIIDCTMAKYEGKVVLAMAEVRDIIKAITNAVRE